VTQAGPLRIRLCGEQKSEQNSEHTAEISAQHLG
tara:strand:+ start:1999 stop:2100 length:102 start_codon:yes stop_codon:yes gene_type:complete